MVKNLPVNAGDSGSIPGWGRSPEGGNGNPIQYYCLGKPMDKELGRATVHGVKRVRRDLATKTATTTHSLNRGEDAGV